MGISRFFVTQDPGPQLGKGDFEFYYSGTLQINDDLKIPAKVKATDVYIDKLDVWLREAPTGRSVLVNFYKNGVFQGQVAVLAGARNGTLFIGRTLVSAGDELTCTIVQVGSGDYGVTMSAYARVTR